MFRAMMLEILAQPNGAALHMLDKEYQRCFLQQCFGIVFRNGQ